MGGGGTFDSFGCLPDGSDTLSQLHLSPCIGDLYKHTIFSYILFYACILFIYVLLCIYGFTVIYRKGLYMFFEVLKKVLYLFYGCISSVFVAFIGNELMWNYLDVTSLCIVLFIYCFGVAFYCFKQLLA